MQGLVAWAAGEARQRLGPLGPRWQHVRAVALRAGTVAHILPAADRSTLVAAAYLHDVGYDPAIAVTGFHPIDGARWLRDNGLDELARLVAHHSGAAYEARVLGLDDQLREFAALPGRMADALTYCDLITGPAGGTVLMEERLAEIDRRYGPQHPVTRAARAAAPENRAAVKRTEARSRRAGRFVTAKTSSLRSLAR